MNAAPQPEETPRPYHERWAEILVYPLQPGPLSTIVAIAVSHLVAHVPLGFILDLLVWAAFFKYAFEVLRWSANGRTEAPEISLTVSDAVSRYAILLLVLAEVALFILTLTYGSAFAIALALLLTFAMPAIVVILAVDEDFFRAVNPFAWLAIAIRLRGTYLVLVGLFVAALVVQSLIAAALREVLPPLLVTPLVFCVVNYLMIADFHLIGWVIHEHADELGYSGHVELQELPADAGPDERIIASARTRAASGDIDGAIALLRDEIAVQPGAVALHEEYRHWLRHEDKQGDLLANSRHYIAALLERGQDHAALDAAREAFALDPGFALDKPEAVTRLAAAAAAAGQSQLALSLLAGFHKRFRNHADIARNYLLAAKLMAERMNREMQARALLQQIKIVLPDDPLIPEVDAYLAFLDQLAATPPRPTPPAQ
jgi:tetratricopeptide (TPR) repeat protein